MKLTFGDIVVVEEALLIGVVVKCWESSKDVYNYDVYVFRPQYRELSEEEKTLLDNIKDKANELLSFYQRLEDMGGIRKV